MWKLSHRVTEMDGDECGNGCTTSTSPGTTSGWYDNPGGLNLTSTLDKVWGLCSPFNCQISSNWSTDWFRVSAAGQTLQGLQGLSADHIVCSTVIYALTSCVLISRLARWAWEQPVKKKSTVSKGTATADFRVEWDLLPTDVQERVIGGLPYENVYQLKAVSKPLRDCIERDSFLALQNEFNLEDVTLTAPYFFIHDGVWQCAGYDSSLQKWRRLPPLTYLPTYCKPDLDLFKEYLLCTKNGIVCMNVSKSSEDRLIVFNVLTREWKELPPLNHRRNPVLMHLVMDSSTPSYQVIVAGSSRSGDERLSRMTEVFDSRTWKWTRTGDLPGPDYALNDYQSGVSRDGSLYCIAFLDQDLGKGILRYNLNKGIWLKNWTYPLPFSTNSTILQLVESWGELYLFSEQENERRVEHCVDRVDWDIDGNGGVSWSLNSVVRSIKMGGRSLEIYPEYTCVPYSKHQLCVFNTIDHSGMVYDLQNHGQLEVLQAPPVRGFNGEGFFSLNPMAFTIQPSFRSKI